MGKHVESLESSGMPNRTKFLGHTWDKREETLEITVPNYDGKEPVTKRNILSHIGSIYNVLGIISPTLAEGKRIYCDMCDEKKSWNVAVSDKLKCQWLKWTVEEC
jgi:hypothetical protein